MGMAKLFTDSFSAFDTENKITDVTSEVPEWSQEAEGWTERSLDLNMLWEVLEKHKKVMQERDKAAGNIGNTWELVVVQTVILVILALIALMWGFCCRKQCFANNNDTVSVSEALRKLSKDLPPSYSTLSPAPLSPAKGEVSAESQGERAARVCDIIHEQR